MQVNDLFIKRTFNRYLLPTILSVLGGTVNVMVDSIIVGNTLGEKGLAAINLCMPVYLILCTAGSLIASGAGSLSSIAVGKNDEQRSKKLYSLSLILIAVIGVVFTVCGLALLSPILRLLGAQGEIATLARSYLSITIMGGGAKMLLYVPFHYLRVDGRAKMVSVMLLAMAIVNIGLDILLVIVFPFGMAGAAWASVFATILAVGIGLLCLRQKSSSFHFVNPGKSPADIIAIIKMGSPVALNNFLSALRIILLNFIMLSVGGNLLVSVFAVMNSIGEFSLCILNGIPQTASPLIGVYSGEKDTGSIRMIMKRQFFTGCCLIIIYAVLIVVFSSQLCTLFGITDELAIKTAAYAVMFYASGLVFAVINSILTYYYNIIGRVALANLMTLCRILLFSVGTAYVVSRLAGQAGQLMIWAFLPISEIGTMAAALLFARLYSRKHKQLSAVYLLDDSLDREGQTINLSVANDMSAAMEASVKINTFCENNDFTPKQTMAISLAIEEILTLILQKSFSKSDTHTVDIRVFKMHQEIGLRFRNGGEAFNPITYYEQNSAADEMGDTLGIKMITKIAKSVQYQRTFGVNSLIIMI